MQRVKTITGTVESTLGRFIFNEILPQDLGFVDRSNPRTLKLEVDFHVGKKQLKQILEGHQYPRSIKTAEVLDDVKAIGYKVLYQSRYDRIHFRYDRRLRRRG